MNKLYSTVSLAFALCLSPSIAGQCGTVISGPVANQTWTAAGSPYCVTARITITSLTIQPGVTVQISDNNWLTVDGTLQAVGTAALPIVFTARDPAKAWRGLIFKNALPGSRLSHCRFDNTRIGPALDLQETNVQIDNCTFFDNPRAGTVAGLRTGAIRATLTTGNLSIDDCTFSDNANLGEGPAITAYLTAGSLIVDNCTFANHSSSAGGAISANLTTGDCVIDGCTFSDNAAADGGAVIVDTAGSIRVSNSTFTGNTADAGNTTSDAGGGAIFASGDATFTQCRFVDNRCRGHRTSQTAIGRGGAICLTQGNATFENCLMTGNLVEASFQNIGVAGAARAYGGAIFVGFGTVRATNCLLSGNSASTNGTADAEERGAGIYAEGFLPVDLVNCTITRGTTLSTTDGGVYLAGGSATIRNSILRLNAGAQISGPGSAAVTYSNVEGATVFPGTGNINVAPVFAGSTAGCEILVPGSPGIDAGDPRPADNDVCFPPSLGGARNDMGAHGGPLACQWNGVVNLVLSTPATLTTPAPLTLALAGGNPGRPALTVITGVNGSPIFVALPLLLIVCPDGTTSLTLNIPLVTPGTTLDFQGYSFDGAGYLVASNTTTVAFQ